MPKTMLEEARERFTVVQVHAPTLDDNMKPDFKLLNSDACPAGKDGHCERCECFKGADLSESEGRVFAYHVFDGFCEAAKKTSRWKIKVSSQHLNRAWTINASTKNEAWCWVSKQQDELSMTSQGMYVRNPDYCTWEVEEAV